MHLLIPFVLGYIMALVVFIKQALLAAVTCLSHRLRSHLLTAYNTGFMALIICLS